MSRSRYHLVAEHIRAEIADGTVSPGASLPSIAALARTTGHSTYACRRALRTLIQEGVLVPGATPNSRARVPAGARGPGEQTAADVARALSASLASRRRAAGLTQPELARIIGTSTTSVGHAETGRLWQSRRFWEYADKALNADGELLALHDAYRVAGVATDQAAATSHHAEGAADSAALAAIAVSEPLRCVAITWADGTVTTVYPPQRRRDTCSAEQ
jgi:DNA-binding transcriptional regulator YhcF (GntR family)